MKRTLVIALTILTLTAYGQDKYNYIHFNKLTEVVGTEYVIASIENWGKMFETKSRYLLFINTITHETKQVDFPNGAYFRDIEQIKIDSLGINLLVMTARAVDLDGKNGIDWNDPTQIFILSPDGKEKIQLTESKFFVRTWIVNKLTGTIVVTGHYDTNNNDKYDKTDKNEIHIYDLKTLKLISKIWGNAIYAHRAKMNNPRVEIVFLDGDDAAGHEFPFSSKAQREYRRFAEYNKTENLTLNK